MPSRRARVRLEVIPPPQELSPTGRLSRLDTDSTAHLGSDRIMRHDTEVGWTAMSMETMMGTLLFVYYWV
jgi:hypothetical protein